MPWLELRHDADLSGALWVHVDHAPCRATRRCAVEPLARHAPRGVAGRVDKPYIHRRFGRHRCSLRRPAFMGGSASSPQRWLESCLQGVIFTSSETWSVLTSKTLLCTAALTAALALHVGAAQAALINLGVGAPGHGHFYATGAGVFGSATSQWNSALRQIPVSPPPVPGTVPEPSTALLAGLALLAAWRSRSRAAAKV